MEYMFHDAKHSTSLPQLCTKKSVFEGNGLVCHLKQIAKGCPVHFGILCYLKALYGSMWNGIGHKYLYNSNDAKYKEAETAEEDKKNYLIKESVDLKTESEKLEKRLKEVKTELKAIQQIIGEYE